MSGLRRPRRDSGYMLLEALVAVAVAGIVLAAFVQSQAVARHAARLPGEILEPSSVAQFLVADWLAHPEDSAATGRRGPYAYRRDVTPVEWIALAPNVAPPLMGPGPTQAPDATTARSFELRVVELHVRKGQGRQLERETAGVFPAR